MDHCVHGVPLSPVVGDLTPAVRSANPLSHGSSGVCGRIGVFPLSQLTVGSCNPDCDEGVVPMGQYLTFCTVTSFMEGFTRRVQAHGKDSVSMWLCVLATVMHENGHGVLTAGNQTDEIEMVLLTRYCLSKRSVLVLQC